MTTWVNRGNVAGANPFAGVACNNSGVSLAIDQACNVYKSTDGGTTWAQIATIALGSGLGQGNVVWDSGSNRWVWGGDGSQIAYSDNTGATWTVVTTGLTSAGTGWVDTNGAGTWICIANQLGPAPNFANSTNNAATWGNQQNLDSSGVFGSKWVSSQFIVAAFNTGGQGLIETSPTGAVWTPTTGTNELFGLDYDSSNFISTTTGGIVKSATALGLLSAAANLIGLTSPAGVAFLHNLWIVFDTDVGTVATSPDAVTWTSESTNAIAGDGAILAAYDTVHATWIVPTFGDGVSGGYILTRIAGVSATVPNVVGLNIGAASAAITGASLTVGAISYAYSATIAPGLVSSSSPVAGTSVAVGSSVAIVVSMGPQPSPLVRRTPKLLLYLHRIFDKDPHQQLAFRLQYDGGLTWAVADGVFTTTVTGGSGRSFSLDLASFTISSLCDFFAEAQGYSVPYRDLSLYAEVNARVLLDHTSNNIATSNGDHVYGYTTLLWAWLEPIGAELGRQKAQITNALAQMNTVSAEDEWLDYHGDFYNVPRNQGELDPNYSSRMIASVLTPRGNNVAIAVAIEKVCLDVPTVRVIDAIDNTSIAITYNGLIHFDGAEFYDAGLGPNGAYGFFDVDFSYDFTGVVAQATYFAQILQTVQAFRDAGTQLRAVIFRNLGSTTTIVSDSFIGRVRVLVYDDFSGNSYRLLESGIVRLLEDGTARILES